MKDKQKKIYYLTGSPEDAMANPFMEPFKDSEIPVLLIGNQVDEMVFQQIGSFKGFTFVNVESGYEEISKDLGEKKVYDDRTPQIPEEDITGFCLWLKEQSKPFVGKVTLSKRLKSVPCVLYG
jgi:molecular chaperone HtpG/TNF receptor-associated protein 1